jgi:hypothetical protein
LIGGCLCGAFKFEVDEPLGEVRLCHCDLCRKANGSAFSANIRVPRSQYRVLGDESSLKEYESSPGAWKVFCSTCGSPAYSRVDSDPDHIRLRLGTLPREISVPIVAHVWVGSKASWDIVPSGLPKFLRGSNGPKVD